MPDDAPVTKTVCDINSPEDCVSDNDTPALSVPSDYYPCMPLAFTRLRTPTGPLALTASGAAIPGVFFPTSRRGPAPTPQAGWVEVTEGPAAALLARARQQLEEYFARTRTTFDLPLEALGSAFEHRVWNALRQIPYGSTTSYGSLAKLLGDKHATRAVGPPNGKHAIAIIVPCHRAGGS